MGGRTIIIKRIERSAQKQAHAQVIMVVVEEKLEPAAPTPGFASGASHGTARSRTTASPASVHPVSRGQESLWFLHSLIGATPLYNIPQAFRIRGPLQIALLEKALDLLIRRHPALRTTFSERDGEVRQSVQPHQPFSLSVVDLTGVAWEQREAQAGSLIDHEVKAPFDLSSDLMIRVKLLKLESNHHILTLVLHHIVSDHASLEVFYREAAELYTGLLHWTGNLPVGSPPQPAQVVESQRSSLLKPEAGKHRAYWRTQLDGVTHDSKIPGGQGFCGSRIPVHLPAEVIRGLSDLGRQRGASPYMTLLAMWQGLFYRYFDQEDIVIGCPFGQRDFPGAEEAIGFFVNTLPIRARLHAEMPFLDVLQQVRDVALEAYSHHSVPIETIVEDLRLPRHRGKNPLFNVVFQYFSTPPARLVLDEVQTESLPVDTGTAKFALTITLAQSGDGLEGDIEFNSEVFSSASVERMMDQFKSLISSVINHPEDKISTLPWMTALEREMIVSQWNQTKTKYPADATVQGLFQEQVRQSPDATALRFENQQLTYRDLNQQANQMAHCLKNSGVKPRDRVGVCLERSPELVVGLLAILKCGACYVPIDPGYPRERVAWMVKDAAVATIITTGEFRARFHFETAFCVDGDRDALALEPTEDLDPGSRSEDPAYIIYTSGSTGEPKGVVVPHRGIVRLVRETNYASFSRDEVFLQFAPVSFDASTFEIWGPLLNGGTLVVFPAKFESIEQLGRVIDENKVSTLWLTAGLFHQIVDHHIGILRPVRQLLAGGDALSVPHVVKALRELPSCHLINGYGPTENTTFTCCYQIPHDWAGGSSVPIGKPISNTQVFILDRNLKSVPVGVTGELYIGGDGLALGYLNNPELTAEKYIDNPVAGALGRKLYKTGDLARYQPGGTIEFLGRSDNQVKIRGFRVELGEVEAAMLRCPMVEEAVVLARRDASGSNSLVAFIVRQPGETAEAQEMRDWLGHKLPGHMVPVQWNLLERLPLTNNGKVDRAALLRLETRSGSDAGALAPATVVEERLVEIWKEVLGSNAISTQDNFFQIGGHSLLATRVISRANEALHCQLSIADLFDRPTIVSLAQKVDEVRGANGVNFKPIRRRSAMRTASTDVLAERRADFPSTAGVRN